jgi:ubiquinone/menaquinone biosynthesis C-methylase UbiE
VTAAFGARIPWRPSWTAERELMDEPEQDLRVLAGNLNDLAMSNRWLGGNLLTLRSMSALAGNLPPGHAVSVLDVATGGADIPAAVAAWARGRALVPYVVATDISMQMLAIARRTSRHNGSGLTFAAADARRLPFQDGAFDIAACSLVLHHMLPADAIHLLREMRRVARRGVIVNDIVRCWHGYVGGWLFGRLLTRNPLTRHDAPLSFRRAYTRDEMAQLAGQAGLTPVQFVGFLGFRFCMTYAVPDHRSFFARAA